MIENIGKVYCIKDYEEVNMTFFIKNKTYNVINVNDFSFSIIGENDKPSLSFNKYSPFNKYILSNHFVSLKELRKLKLEKILKIQK